MIFTCYTHFLKKIALRIGVVSLLPVLTGLSTCRSPDEDGDDWTVEDGDCDDSNSNIHPGAVEICDGLDNDCDGSADESLETEQYVDADGDGYGTGEPVLGCEAVGDGYASTPGDCDDSSVTTHPDAMELCGNDVDEDCDELFDNGCVNECILTGSWLDELGRWYELAEYEGGTVDGDVWWESCLYTMIDGIYDPGSLPAIIFSAGSVYVDCPGAVAFQGNLGEDCDHMVSSDDASHILVRMVNDEDGDGYYLEGGDCDDKNAVIHPGAMEACDGLDNDCDGVTDDACISTQCSLTGEWKGERGNYLLEAPDGGGEIVGSVSYDECWYDIRTGSFTPMESPQIYITAWSENCNWEIALRGNFGSDCDRIKLDNNETLIRAY